jgi:hypothetical protein
VIPASKQCSACGRVLPAQMFSPFLRRGAWTIYSRCRDCSVVIRRERGEPPGRQWKPGTWKPGPKAQARAKVHSEIRAGRLLRGACEICGEPGQAHHSDYSKPLEVRWLCPKHHGVEHRRPVAEASLLARQPSGQGEKG